MVSKQKKMNKSLWHARPPPLHCKSSEKISKFFGPLPLNKIFMPIWYIFFPSSKILHRFISFEKKFLGFRRLPGYCFQQNFLIDSALRMFSPMLKFLANVKPVPQAGSIARQRGELPIEWQWRLISWHDTSGNPAAPFPCTTQHTETQTQTIWRQRCSTMDLWDRAFTVFWFAAIVLSTTCVHRWRQLQPSTHPVSFPVPIQGLHDPQKSNSKDCLVRMNI